MRNGFKYIYDSTAEYTMYNSLTYGKQSGMVTVGNSGSGVTQIRRWVWMDGSGAGDVVR